VARLSSAAPKRECPEHWRYAAVDAVEDAGEHDAASANSSLPSIDSVCGSPAQRCQQRDHIGQQRAHRDRLKRRRRGGRSGIIGWKTMSEYSGNARFPVDGEYLPSKRLFAPKVVWRCATNRRRDYYAASRS